MWNKPSCPTEGQTKMYRSDPAANKEIPNVATLKPDLLNHEG